MQVRPAFIVSGVSPDPREGKDYEGGGALVWCTTLVHLTSVVH